MPFLNGANQFTTKHSGIACDQNYCFLRVPMDQVPRKKTLKELRNEAIAELEVVVTTFAARRRRKSE